MAQPSASPTLTPQLCFNERAVREFFRLSRSSIDDSISTHLNALVTPSTSNPLTHSTTTTIDPRPAASRRPIGPDACATFKSTILFPTWSARTDLLEYCSHVATSPDPEDPTLPLRQLQSEADRNRVVNERLDPYSGRFSPLEPRTERLATLLRNEMAVERIVRRRTWAVVAERCGDVTELENPGNGNGNGSEGWERALDQWRQARGEKGKTTTTATTTTPPPPTRIDNRSAASHRQHTV